MKQVGFSATALGKEELGAGDGPTHVGVSAASHVIVTPVASLGTGTSVSLISGAPSFVSTFIILILGSGCAVCLQSTSMACWTVFTFAALRSGHWSGVYATSLAMLRFAVNQTDVGAATAPPPSRASNCCLGVDGPRVHFAVANPLPSVVASAGATVPWPART